MTKIRFAVIAAICLLGASLASAQYVNPSAPNYGVNKMGQCYNSTLNNWVDVLPTTANYTVYPVQCDQYGNLTGVSAPAKISTSAITVNSLASGTDTTAGTASTTGGTMTASAYNYARIVAIDAAGNHTAPNTISAAKTTTGTTASIAWSWTAVTGALSYQVWVCTGSSCTPAHYFTSPTNVYLQTLPATSGTSGTLPTVNNTGQITGMLGSPYWADHVDGYSILSTDANIRVTGASNAVVTLPVAGLMQGQIIRVSNKLTNSANVTVNAVGGPAIGNSGNDTSEVVWTYGSTDTFQWDGTMWWVIAH
jgi:hypothetical protein